MRQGTFVPLSTSDRLEALKSGQIDLLARNTTWNLSREAHFGLSFAGTTYFDGQGFMVPAVARCPRRWSSTAQGLRPGRIRRAKRNQADYFRRTP